MASQSVEYSNQGALEGLPFLVTHWLANFESGGGSNSDEEQRAIDRIRNASAEIASAFASLGAFGTTIRPSLSTSLTQGIETQNATYSDIRRSWNGVSPLHLETIAHAMASTNAVVETMGNARTPNLLEAVHESRTVDCGGRTVQDAISIDETSKGSQEDTPTMNALSILQSPSLVTSTQEQPNTKQDLSNLEAERPTATIPSLQARSSYVDLSQTIAEIMRAVLETREKVKSEKVEIHGLETSIANQAAMVVALDDKYQRLAQEGSDMTRMLEVSDEVKAGRQECERVTAQLQRKLVELRASLNKNEEELLKLEQKVKVMDVRRKGVVRSTQDPYWSWPGKLAPNCRIGANSMLQTIMGRQQGMSRPRNAFRPARSSILSGPIESHFAATRKALLATRLSHAATINTHLGYPVYCLRFDRTGRYFISGADDYLVKVFHLRSGQSCRDKNPNDGSRMLRCNYGANLRGAVLVCSLRGHAGVINDIDVSSDNAFLATASVDGDVRVWGLRDGCPVAILRGHEEGANMVSWSKLTPYRLLSTGSDGFARMWDIREACLKRYGAYVGKRPEYRLNLTDEEKKEELEGDGQPPPPNNQVIAPLPPLPVRREALPSGATPVAGAAAAVQASSQGAANGDPPTNDAVIVPPLPAAVPPLPGDAGPANPAAPNANENEIVPLGQFVANGEMDEGVKLLSKFKHGSSGPDVVGPGTRARRSAVNVICVARNPLGLYFATGSDDGICRIFEDEEETKVAIVDRREEDSCLHSQKRKLLRSRSVDDHSAGTPVLKLMGHVSAITDLYYSNVGDRLLSASQKDGVVRIWSLGKPKLQRKGENAVTQIVIKLTDPGARSSSPATASRRTHGGTSRTDTSKVSCDVAVWTHDDTKIITSQSVLIKQSGSDIQPGSQYLFLWDSTTGQCLIGISGAHTMQCPVVVPHPMDSSLVCTAGADGIAKLWEWESGKCIFTHTNKVEFGPVEPADRNKLAGYLDGAFSPDGTVLVLTDDSGRLTVLDSSLVESDEQSSNNMKTWMREQYFANDYYELFYDRSGYCIERGSERPPHLAPRGVRCNHSGSPWSEDITEAFLNLVGPTPLPEKVCAWRRAEIRRRATAALEYNSALEKQTMRARRPVREFDPLSTIVIKAAGHIEDRRRQHLREANPGSRGTSNAEASSSRSSSRTMSANYRYLDYDDMMRLQGNQDDDEVDTDDEEFSPTVRNNRVAFDNSDDESDNDMDLDEVEAESPLPSRRRNRGDQGGRHQRAQRRAQRRNSAFVELGSDDENDIQFMSTNNTPSGPFVEDYEHHFWRMPNGRVRRKWLRRFESDSSYEGRKIYTPQLGDSVVYIPKAHYETLVHFPSLEPPWLHWPQGTAWPVVRCCVRGVRFRFPYQDYFRASGCNSVVAILTLEVTGIPELSDNREFPWPKPSFIDPTSSFVFELSVFQSDQCEFIFPEGLYKERLEALEAASREHNHMVGVPVSAYYDEAPGRNEDAPLDPSPGEIVSLLHEDEAPSSPHLNGSGFGILRVGFNDESEWVEDFSPWDLSMADLSIRRPHLSEDDKKLVTDNVNIQCRKDRVAELFNMPVDKNRYCDYERMVEVEMNLMHVKRRLGEDYYASKFSVIQDFRLIRDNCIKYNGAEHELAAIAKTMCNEFEAAILTEEERSFLQESDSLVLTRNETQSRRTPTIRIRLRQRTNRVSAPQNQETTNNRARDRLRRQSTLENLPAPEPPSLQTTRRGRMTRAQPPTAGRRTRSMDSVINREEASNQRRSLRSRGQPANLESLSRLQHSQGRSGTDAISFGIDTGLQERTAHLSRPARGGTSSASDGLQQRATRSSLRSSTMAAAQTTNEDQSSIGASDEVDETANLRSRRTTRAAAAGGLPADEESDPEEQAAASRGPMRRSSRKSSVRSESETNAGVGSEADEDSVHDSVASEEEAQSDAMESDASPPRRNTRKAKTERPATRSSPRAKRSVVAFQNEESPTRKSSRTRSTRNTSYEETSDFEPDDDDDDHDGMDEDEFEDEGMSPRSRSRKNGSYAEHSDSEDEDDFLEDEGPSRSSRSKRKRRASPASKRAKPKKKSPQQKIQLKAWPKIDIKKITPVCEAMLRVVKEEDQDGTFNAPVLESYPDIAESYLSLVDHPMDLRTIEEDRMQRYLSIKELQDDLILMFKNCCDFNGADSDMGQYAMNIWCKLNKLFSEVCEEEGVDLGRWRP